MGIFPAERDGDDIKIFRDSDLTLVAGTAYHLRQQTERGKNSKSQYNFALSDFIADKESGQRDWLGMFAVCAGLEEPDLVEGYKPQAMITTPFCSKPSATAWQKPWRNTCILNSAPTFGAIPTNNLTTKD